MRNNTKYHQVDVSSLWFQSKTEHCSLAPGTWPLLNYLPSRVHLSVCVCVADPRFVSIHQIPESDNPEDDKIYLFFRENAMDGEHAGKATHARIGQLCKVRIGTLTVTVTRADSHKGTHTKGERQWHTHTHADIMWNSFCIWKNTWRVSEWLSSWQLSGAVICDYF